MNFCFPTKIYVERDCVKKHANVFSACGKRCLIVTGKSSAVKCGALQDVTEVLDNSGIAYAVFDKIPENPPFEVCKAGAQAAHEFNAQFIVGIGGGSPLDAAKAIACLALNPEIGEQRMYAQQLDGDPLPVIAVGTTAGTGSEVTQVAVITDSSGIKRSFRADSAFPIAALGDPHYTEFMPDSVTRSTAADALCHCTESYFNTTATEFSDVYALRGAQIISEQLSELTLTCEQREKLYIGSLMGGIAISVTGTCIPHALSYFLTENHGMAHGTACAFWMPAFINHVTAAVPERAKRFFDTVKLTPDGFVKLIENTVKPEAVTVTADEKASLMPRLQYNSCLKKAPGNIDARFLAQLIDDAF